MHRWCLHAQLVSPNPLILALLFLNWFPCLKCIPWWGSPFGVFGLSTPPQNFQRRQRPLSRVGGWRCRTSYDSCVPQSDGTHCSFSRGGSACCRTSRSGGARFSSLRGGGAQQCTFSLSCHGWRNQKSKLTPPLKCHSSKTRNQITNSLYRHFTKKNSFQGHLRLCM